MRLFWRKKKAEPWRTITSFGADDDINDESLEHMSTHLTRPSELSEWLIGNGDDGFEAFGNRRLADFFNVSFEGRQVRRRFCAYNKYIEMDMDRIRMHGKFYNNIYLGRRIFGPARKQVFSHTIVGGMERRFEIIDNQINHIAFAHEASDKFQDKCRNPRIKCRDDTRVVLRRPPSSELFEEEDFIHANYVRSPILFNDFIVTQAPLPNTIFDFWRMVWQEQSRYIFMLISRKDVDHCTPYWPRRVGDSLRVGGLQILNDGIEPLRDMLFRVTRLVVIGPERKKLRIEHWQADMNNSENVESPLQLLRLARSCARPTIVHDYLGVSRAACLIAAELCIAQLIRGPMYKHPVQRAVHYLRSKRAFSIETPMQYIFVHRLVQHFIRPMVGAPVGFRQDYARWLDERSQRLFLDDFNRSIPAYCLISPKVDPDLLPLVRHRERPEFRRELHAHVGELPLPVDLERKRLTAAGREDGEEANERTRMLDHGAPAAGVERPRLYSANNYMPKRYPRGRRY